MKGDSIEADKTYELDYYERDGGDQVRDSVIAVKGEVSFVRKRQECMFHTSIIVTILLLAINGAILGLQLNKDPGNGNVSEYCEGNNESETVHQELLTGQYFNKAYTYTLQ